jgi:uncharacterized protein YegL
MNPAPPRPRGVVNRRPLHFIWICDCSGSMAENSKIHSLNIAIREAIPAMRDVADENIHAQMYVRAVRFSDGAQWHVAQPQPIEQFQWQNIAADGLTSLGHALKLVAEQLKSPPMEQRALPPVLVLVSDGMPTDNWREGLNALMSEPWGKRAVRIAIAIGKEAADPDIQRVFNDFIGNPEIKLLQANNAETLTRYIKWVSTALVQAVSQPKSVPIGNAVAPMKGGIPPMPDADDPPPTGNVGSVW